MSNGINTFLRLLQGQQQAAPVPMANMQRPYQLPGGRTPPMALSGLQKAQAAQLARGTGGPAPRVLPMLADVAQGKYISPLQKALMQQATEQPVVDTSMTMQGAGDTAQTTFGQRFSKPTTQALLGAAVEGADASGWSKVPVSTGQVLARMGAGAMQAYGDAEERMAAQKAAAQKARIDALNAAAAYAKATKGEKPTLRMVPVDGGGEQLAMIDPYTGKITGRIGGVKPPSGFGVEIGPDGTVRFTQGAGAGLEKGTKKDIEGDIVTLSNQISMLDQASATYDPTLLTYGAELENLFGTTLAKINPDALSADQKERLGRRTQFIRGIQQTFSTLLNELSGAAVSNFELGNARKYSVNPNDDPISFEAKLRDQRGFANAALFRAQAVLGGEPITTNLAKKYPISISGKNSAGQTKILYMHEFVEKYMAQNNVDQATALAAYAEAAKK